LDLKEDNAGKQERVILIVEDEFDLRSTLSMLFELHGFKTLNANNGKQALDLVEKHRPGIVLSDCMMPVMDGIALSNALRANPATADIPIVLMSAAPQQHNLAEASFEEFVQKPFQFNALLDTILRLLPLS
jgi:CheY-like chemotaxis protein